MHGRTEFYIVERQMVKNERQEVKQEEKQQVSVCQFEFSVLLSSYY